MNDEELVDGFHKAVDQVVDVNHAEAAAMLAALRSAGFQVFRPDELLPIGWCPRGEGHADMPEPDDPNDFGMCGSKWTYSAFMTPWVPADSGAHDEHGRGPVLVAGQYAVFQKVDGEWPEDLICELLDIAETEPRGIDKAAAHWQSRLDALTECIHGQSGPHALTDGQGLAERNIVGRCPGPKTTATFGGSG